MLNSPCCPAAMLCWDVLIWRFPVQKEIVDYSSLHQVWSVYLLNGHLFSICLVGDSQAGSNAMPYGDKAIKLNLSKHCHRQYGLLPIIIGLVTCCVLVSLFLLCSDFHRERGKLKALDQISLHSRISLLTKLTETTWIVLWCWTIQMFASCFIFYNFLLIRSEKKLIQ